MTKIVPITRRHMRKNIIIERGIPSSIMYTSLENRFTILPRGVVSKNDMGERRTFRRRLLWIPRDALVAPLVRRNPPNSRATAWLSPKPPYTPTYVSLVLVFVMLAVLQSASQIPDDTMNASDIKIINPQAKKRTQPKALEYTWTSEHLTWKKFVQSRYCE